jgi:hypothetical protein
MKTAIKELMEKRKKLNEDLDKVDKALKALRELCEHQWQYDGHTSHEDYEVCTNCGDGRYV